jgi:signal transduction histidine kinase
MWENLGDRAQVLEELSRGGSIRQRECRWRNLRAEQFTVLLSAETITLGNAPHVLLLALDISKRKLAEAELHKTLAREKELGQLRSKFVSMVSHEFRTPLGIIQSSAEILSDYLERLEPGERRDHLLSIQKNTRRMAGLMEEVLLIGSIEAGKMDFKPAVLDLRNFVRRLADEVLSATDRRCPIDLKLGVLPVHIRGDERLLRHIFTNLLTNAIKYSEPGQPVQFEIDCDDTAIVSTIRDRGIGIPEADQEWLFSAFHRGSNVGERPGTGLGLLIVKRCADLHGGKISLKSAPGQGTTATFRLPKLIAAVEITSDLLNPILEVQI